jgi:hypothetical protein
MIRNGRLRLIRQPAAGHYTHDHRSQKAWGNPNSGVLVVWLEGRHKAASTLVPIALHQQYLCNSPHQATGAQKQKQKEFSVAAMVVLFPHLLGCTSYPAAGSLTHWPLRAQPRAAQLQPSSQMAETLPLPHGFVSPRVTPDLGFWLLLFSKRATLRDLLRSYCSMLSRPGVSKLPKEMYSEYKMAPTPGPSRHVVLPAFQLNT